MLVEKFRMKKAKDHEQNMCRRSQYINTKGCLIVKKTHKLNFRDFAFDVPYSIMPVA